MLNLKFNQFDLNSEEGMLLLASISILTSDVSEFGGSITPDEAFEKVQDIANKVFFNEEYNQYKLQKNREELIDKIL